MRAVFTPGRGKVADEQVFLQGGGVLVSSTRIEIGGQTFATRNVGSVKLVAPGMSKLGVVLAIVGVLAALGASAAGGKIFGLCLAAIGGIWAWSTARRRRLMLVAGGGEIMALETSNGGHAEALRSAIAQAISVR